MRITLFLALILSLPAVAGSLNLSIDAGNNQVAEPGDTLPIDPAVFVSDSNGLPVAGETVEFSIAAGGGLVSGASQTTDSNGIAAVGQWTLGLSPGLKELRAELASQPKTAVTFFAVAEAETALSVNLTGPPELVAGEPYLYTLTVSNSGPYTAEDVQVYMDFDPQILSGSIAWICESGGGSAACGAPSGSGFLFDHAVVPPQGHVTYTVAAAVPINLIDGEVLSEAHITPPPGIIIAPADGAQDDHVVQISANTTPIFSDRFQDATP